MEQFNCLPILVNMSNNKKTNNKKHIIKTIIYLLNNTPNSKYYKYNSKIN